MPISERIKYFVKLALILAVPSNMVGMTPLVAAPSSEIQALTVAFLFNFMKLSEWPQATIAGDLVLCTVQAGDYAIDVDSLDGKTIQNNRLKVRHLLQGDNSDECHLLYIPENEKPIRLQEWLKILRNKPVLSVSSVPGFLEQGGMIELVSDGDHLQFEVNLIPVDEAGIKLSSKMLQIARKVQGNR